MAKKDTELKVDEIRRARKSERIKDAKRRKQRDDYSPGHRGESYGDRLRDGFRMMRESGDGY